MRAETFLSSCGSSIFLGFNLFSFIGSLLLVCCAPMYPEEGGCKFMAAGVLLIFAGITQLITAVVILAIFATKEPIGFLFVAVFIGVGALNIHGGLLCLRAEQAIVQARLKRGKAVPQYYSEEEDGQYYDEEQQAPSIPVTVRLAC
jgi:hypothetical protein